MRSAAEYQPAGQAKEAPMAKARPPPRPISAAPPTGMRGVTVGRDATGNAYVTGDYNTTSTTVRNVVLPPAETVDISAELAALRELLAKLESGTNRGRLDRAMQDAVEEIALAQPDKHEVAIAVERSIEYAKRSPDFDYHAANLVPHLAAIASWAGVAGRALLDAI